LVDGGAGGGVGGGAAAANCRGDIASQIHDDQQSSRSSCSTNSTTADEDDDFQVRARSVDCPPAAGSQIEEASTARGARVSSSPNLEQNSDHEIDDDDEMKLIVHI